jgi:hypothetical protein
LLFFCLKRRREQQGEEVIVFQGRSVHGFVVELIPFSLSVMLLFLSVSPNSSTLVDDEGLAQFYFVS